jgi:hypothetical protein
LTNEDLEQLSTGIRLLDGETVGGTWEAADITVEAHSVSDLAAGPLGQGEGLLESFGSFAVSIAGNPIPVGTGKERLLSARVTNWDEAAELAEKSPDGQVTLHLVRGATNRFEWTLQST